uniref:Uncharacterized protein n=1 Tax=Dicentrarchus labrax TaxID=13489 RepID=A0A8C4IMC4_DICLA
MERATYHISPVSHEDGECYLGESRRRLTSRCSSVKITGSATNTRLDSLVIEADRMWELTVRERLRLFGSPIPLSVAFSVLRN